MPDSPSALAVRPTTHDAASPRRRPLALAAGSVAVLMVLLLGFAVAADRDSDHPGARSGIERVPFINRLMPPPNAAVDGFEYRGDLGELGHWSWVASGENWVADGSFARLRRQPPLGLSYTVADPGERSIITQVDVYSPEPGSGLVFRWRSQADHWGLEATAKPGEWELVRVVDTQRTVIRRFTAPPNGATLHVRLGPGTVEVLLEGTRVAVASSGQGEGTAVGMIATGVRVRFDEFAVLVT